MLKKYGLNLSLAIMAIMAVSVGAILISLMAGTTGLVSDMLLRQSQNSNLLFAETLKDYQAQALERAEMIASSTDIINAVANKDEEAVAAALRGFSSGVDLITLCDTEGTVLARSHSDKKGDSVIGQEAIAAALNTGTGISTIEPGSVIGLSTRGSAAIKDKNGNIIGALTCGHDLSQTKYIDTIKTQSNCEATFFAGNQRMNTTLVDAQGNRVTGTEADPAIADTVLNKKQDYSGRVELFGNLYQVYYSPVIVKNQAVGMLFTGTLAEDAVNQERNMIILIVIAALLLLFVVFTASMIIRWTSGKIHWYEEILDAIPFPVSVTDMNMNWTFINKPVEQMLNVKRADMIGKPCSSWGAGICNTNNCGVNCLRNGKNTTFFEQAGMDFQVDTSYLLNKKQAKDGHIEVVQDISERVKSQKSEALLVEKIGDVSEAFVSASHNIANNASALAQNSMEQSASVQELSSAISDISEKTKTSADLATKAASLADTIKADAEAGSLQMDKMTLAVEEINQSSQSISKVIKVIDDIAFQTNILALNAAVEAARAGQHGKGFAVVADEVRNLAAKSAEAANGTGTLIANSMEKAQLGVRIASETASSLKDIVSGIDESSNIIKAIASASTEQNATIAEINRAIDEVARNVQQNSATAEESAASSEEMSGQTEFLQNLINDFHNKTDGTSQRTAPPQSDSMALSGSTDKY